MQHELARYDLPALVSRPLDRGWPTGVAAQHVILTHFSDMLAWRQDVVNINTEAPGPEDIEAVHKIRVASRRTRTAVRTFADLWPHKLLKPFHRELSDFTQAFNAARDLDVMSDYLRGMLLRETEDHRPAIQAALSNTILLRMYEQDRLVQTILGLEHSGFHGEFIEQFSKDPYDLWTWEGASGQA